jgi:hypothetical protein
VRDCQARWPRNGSVEAIRRECQSVVALFRSSLYHYRS